MVGKGVLARGGRLRTAGWVCWLVVIISLLVGQQARIAHELGSASHDDHHCELCLASASLAGAPLASGWAMPVRVDTPDQYHVAPLPPTFRRIVAAPARAPPLPA